MSKSDAKQKVSGNTIESAFAAAGIEPCEIRELTRLDPRITAGYILLQWALIVAAALLCWHFWHPLLYLVTVVFIGARQHDLATMVHEAAHYRFARNRRLNDWLGEAMSWPFVILSMRTYRQHHGAHHRYLNTDRDPDWIYKQDDSEWRFPMSRTKLGLVLLGDLLGIGLVKTFIRTLHLTRPQTARVLPDATALRLARVVFLAIALSLIIVFDLGAAVALFWLVPFVTWLQVCLRLRSIAEHFAFDTSHDRPHSRSVMLTWLDRALVLSNDTSLHGEHHLYPSVPFYRLRDLHELLVRSPDYRHGIELTRGYWSVVKAALGRSASIGVPS